MYPRKLLIEKKYLLCEAQDGFREKLVMQTLFTCEITLLGAL